MLESTKQTLMKFYLRLLRHSATILEMQNVNISPKVPQEFQFKFV
jgi:hypothetical protein